LSLTGPLDRIEKGMENGGGMVSADITARGSGTENEKRGPALTDFSWVMISSRTKKNMGRARKWR
jgi:hypothetical protein